MLDDTSSISARRANLNLQALEGIHDHFANKSPRFSNYFGKLDGFQAASLEVVFSQPVSSCFSRTAFELAEIAARGPKVILKDKPYLQSVLDKASGDTFWEKFDNYLSGLGNFVLGLALVEEKTLDFKPSLDLPPNTRIPGTPFVTLGKEPISPCLGVGRFGEEVAALFKDSGSYLVSYPSILDGRIFLGGADYQALSGLYVGAEMVSRSAEYYNDKIPVLEAALGNFESLMPELFENFSSEVQHIALDEIQDGIFENLTHSHFPGSFVVSFINNPAEFADSIIHEYSHGALFEIERKGPLLLSDSTKNYSPVRKDPRPLHGVFHALYVHSNVANYWRRALNNKAIPKEHARDRFSRIVLQNYICLQQLKHLGDIAPTGAELLSELEKQVLAQVEEATELANATSAVVCKDSGSLAPLNKTVSKVIFEHLEFSQSDSEKERLKLSLESLGLRAM